VNGSRATLLASSDDELRWLADCYASGGERGLLGAAICDYFPGRIALVSSFGAEAIVTLHLVSLVQPDIPVIFLDTGKHFTATLDYVERLAAQLRLTDLRIERPSLPALTEADPFGLLHRKDADRCCGLRKVEPLQRALQGFEAWITGRKRAHGGARAQLEPVVRDAAGRLRVNPLCHWDTARVESYMREHELPRHPLQREGYLSIGCAPCTARSAKAADPRGGRWAGQAKSECGIHFL